MTGDPAGRLPVIAGMVLAGGRSRRFGSEKAVARLDGRLLIAHAAAALEPRCTPLAVNTQAGSAAQAWGRARGLTTLCDPAGAPDGPLSGVLEGLRWAAGAGIDLLATVPCDTPRLPLDLVPRLLRALVEGAPAAAARTAQGVQPLCALWRTDLAARLAGELARGHPPVRRLLVELGAAQAVFEDAAAFANVNTIGDIVPAGGGHERADKGARIGP